jgi:hypothetical protein
MADSDILKEIRSLQIESLQRITVTETKVGDLVKSQEKMAASIYGNGGRGLMEAARDHEASIERLAALADCVCDNEERVTELEEAEAKRQEEKEKQEELANAAKGDYRKTKLGLISAVVLAIINALIVIGTKVFSP